MLFPHEDTNRTKKTVPNNAKVGPGSYVGTPGTEAWLNPSFKFGSGKVRRVIINPDLTTLGEESPGPLADYQPEIPRNRSAPSLGPRSRGYVNVLPGDIDLVQLL